MRDNTHTVQNTKKKKYFQSSELEQRRINLNRNGGEDSSGQPEIGDLIGVYVIIFTATWTLFAGHFVCKQTNELKHKPGRRSTLVIKSSLKNN